MPEESFKKGITIQELSKELDEYKEYEKNPSRFKNRLRLHWLKNRLVSKNAAARKLYSIIRKKDDIDYRKEYENVGLQGSCIIISQKSIFKMKIRCLNQRPFYIVKKNLYTTNATIKDTRFLQSINWDKTWRGGIV